MMSDNSRIEWTDATWSPTLGCTKVSPGCDNCYAIKTVHRLAGNPNPKIHEAAEGLTAYRPGHGLMWTGNVRTLPGRLDIPLRWRKPRRIFVDSQSDLFHDRVPDEFIASVFAVMAATPQHTYQILTKRHSRMRSLLASETFTREVFNAYTRKCYGVLYEDWWPLRNVWLGVSVEDQKWADTRIPALLDTPAAVRFLSCEPLLGPVDLSELLTNRKPVTDDGYDAPDGAIVDGMERVGDSWERREQVLHWLIVGGESGHQARPMHPEWARGLRDQCVTAGIPFLFKQWGEWGPAPWVVRVCDPAVGWQGTKEELAVAKADAEARGATHVYASWAHEYGHDLYEPVAKPWSIERADPLDDHQAPMRRWGKHAAGRELDGRTWDQYPAVTT